MTTIETPRRVVSAPSGARVPRSAEAPAPRSTGYARWGKRAVHYALLIPAVPIALAFALPIALINGILFRDPRRILFRQERIGYRGERFRIWKFRTMREGAPDGEFESWCNGHDDSRVTAFGRFLRSTHLDEVPQILNILAGEMDFIGPRPEMVEVHEWACRRIPDFHRRTVMRPGITGLAQVTQGYVARNQRAYRAKLAADLEYARRLSLRLELQILLKTAMWMLRRRGWNPIDHLPNEPLPLDAQGAEPGERVLEARAGTMAPCPPTALSLDMSRTRASSSTTPVLRIRNDLGD